MPERVPRIIMQFTKNDLKQLNTVLEIVAKTPLTNFTFNQSGYLNEARMWLRYLYTSIQAETEKNADTSIKVLGPQKDMDPPKTKKKRRRKNGN